MRVYIVRHAAAHKVGEEGIKSDEERFLSPKGHQASECLGRALNKIGIQPVQVLSSPLRRAFETAELVAGQLTDGPQVKGWEALAPPYDAPVITGRLQEARGDIMLVGHAPFLGHLVQLILSGEDEPPIPLSKATAVCLEGDDLLEEVKLRWVLNKELAKVIAND